MNYRSYVPADKPGCLEIFRSNTPDFFGVHEEPEFADFLERAPCPYFVLQVDNQLIGCGGYFIDEEKRMGRMCWGMVRHSFHKKNYGKYLLLKRLEAISQLPQIEQVSMDTSQHSKGFFEKLGFIILEVEQDGYFPGLHRHEMELKLNNENRYNISSTLAGLEKQLNG